MLQSLKSPSSLCPSLESPSSLRLSLELLISLIPLDPGAAPHDHLELHHTLLSEPAELPSPGAAELCPSQTGVAGFPLSQSGATQLLLSYLIRTDTLGMKVSISLKVCVLAQSLNVLCLQVISCSRLGQVVIIHAVFLVITVFLTQLGG